MLLKLLIKLGIKEVSVAGFDGYEPVITDNYADKDMSINTGNNAETINAGISQKLRSFQKILLLVFNTYKIYQITVLRGFYEV